jgi:hypothetical protein
VRRCVSDEHFSRVWFDLSEVPLRPRPPWPTGCKGSGAGRAILVTSRSRACDPAPAPLRPRPARVLPLGYGDGDMALGGRPWAASSTALGAWPRSGSWRTSAVSPAWANSQWLGQPQELGWAWRPAGADPRLHRDSAAARPAAPSRPGPRSPNIPRPASATAAIAATGFSRRPRLRAPFSPDSSRTPSDQLRPR